jgi:hypothetical protein
MMCQDSATNFRPERHDGTRESGMPSLAFTGETKSPARHAKLPTVIFKNTEFCTAKDNHRAFYVGYPDSMASLISREEWAIHGISPFGCEAFFPTRPNTSALKFPKQVVL